MMNSMQELSVPSLFKYTTTTFTISLFTLNNDNDIFNNIHGYNNLLCLDEPHSVTCMDEAAIVMRLVSSELLKWSEGDSRLGQNT